MNTPMDRRKQDLISEYNTLLALLTEAGIPYDTGIPDPYQASSEDLITKIRFMKFALRTPRG